MRLYDKNTLIKQLNKGLEQLSEKERMVLTLFYFEEMTEDEIAQILDISIFDENIYLMQAKVIMSSFTPIFEDIDKLGINAVRAFGIRKK